MYRNSTTTDEEIEAYTSSLISNLVSTELGISAAMMVFFGPLSGIDIEFKSDILTNTHIFKITFKT